MSAIEPLPTFREWDRDRVVDDLHATIDNLEKALTTARLIGAAIGIVMTEKKLTYDDAFALLSRTSQHANRKLRSLAEDVLLTGTLPQ